MIIQYYQQSTELSAELPNQVGSGLNGSYANHYVSLPSDPDELVDQLKLLYFEKLGGNDSFLLNEQIVPFVDELLEYECITTNQHQNLISTFTKKDQFVD